MSTPDEIEPPQEWKPARDIPGWGLALGLFVLFVVFQMLRGFPRFTSIEGVLRVLVTDLAMLGAPVVLGWAIVAIPEAIARRRGRPRTALRRNTLIAGWILGVLTMVGMVAENPSPASTARTTDPARPAVPMAAPTPPPPPSMEQSKRTKEPAPVISGPSEAATATKPAPWTAIAAQPEYIQASGGERKAIRDLYWRICIEHFIPREQRTSAYEMFLRDWEIGESDVPAAPSRSTSVAQYLREQQYGVPSPVNAGTMHRWCEE
jgi:hypothetical protein